MIFKIDFHIHTSHSQCSGNSLGSIFSACREKGIIPAITDHNDIAGALEYAEKYGFCIIGEEVETLEGEVIGLNLKKKIPPSRSAEWTLKEIKSQGGITLIPHPKDRLRGTGLKNPGKYAELIDCIEVFNSRTISKEDNIGAEELCRDMGKVAIVGSDAHYKSEIGNAYVTLEMGSKEEIRDSGKLLKALAGSTFKTMRSPLHAHALTFLERLR